MLRLASSARPMLISMAFWVALAQVVVFFVIKLVSSGPTAMTVLYAGNIIVLVSLWYLLRWDTPKHPSLALIRPVAFIVTALALGFTGSSGEHSFITLLGFANLVFVVGLVPTLVTVIVLSAVLGAADLFSGNPWTRALGTSFTMLVAALFVVGLAQSVLIAERRRREADELNDRIRELATAEERARIARDMHDSIGHHLTVIKMSLHNATRLRTRSEHAAWQQVERADSLTSDALRDTRLWVRALRPIPFDGAIELDTLRKLADSFSDTGLRIDISIQGAAPELPAEIGLVIYRLTQEALTNVVRHANAMRVGIDLRIRPDTAELRIEDDGDTRRPITEGFGINSMRQRVAELDGEFRLSTSEHGGLGITVSLPYATGHSSRAEAAS